MVSPEKARYSKAVSRWLMYQILACAVSGASFGAFSSPMVLLFICGPLIASVIQVALVSEIVWRINSQEKGSCMMIGAASSLLVPVAIFLVVPFLKNFSDFFIAVTLALYLCNSMLLAGGLIGGAWLGNVRWKLINLTRSPVKVAR